MTPNPPNATLATVMDPQAVTLGAVYAEALLESLPDDVPAEEYQRELQDLSRLLSETPGAWTCLTNPACSASQRGERVRRIFAGRVSEPVERLLGVLANNRRLPVLPAIAEQFRTLLDRRNHRQAVTVRSAVPMSESQRDDLRRRLSEALRCDVRLNEAVDPGVVGGLVVQVGDTVYDASVAGGVETWKARFSPEPAHRGKTRNGKR